MTALIEPATASDRPNGAADHLWMHFTRMGNFADKPVPVIERGEGAYLWDTNGRKYLDALDGGQPHQHIQERFDPTLVVRASSVGERLAARS